MLQCCSGGLRPQLIATTTKSGKIRYKHLICAKLGVGILCHTLNHRMSMATTGEASGRISAPCSLPWARHWTPNHPWCCVISVSLVILDKSISKSKKMENHLWKSHDRANSRFLQDTVTKEKVTSTGKQIIYIYTVYTLHAVLTGRISNI